MQNFLNPNEILNKLELQEDMIAADFGCGSGGWVIPLSKILKNGKVYAIDVQEEMISALKGKAEIEKIFNIETKRENLEKGSGLRENILDLVLMTNLLFQLDNKKGIISDAKKVLKSGGKILVIDWLKDSPFGPKEGRISIEEVKNQAKDIGFKIGKEFSASPYHWGLILKKD